MGVNCDCHYQDRGVGVGVRDSFLRESLTLDMYYSLIVY